MVHKPLIYRVTGGIGSPTKNLTPPLGDRDQVFLEDRPRGSACAFYVACLIAALEHLHERCIVHRSLVGRKLPFFLKSETLFFFLNGQGHMFFWDLKWKDV